MISESVFGAILLDVPWSFASTQTTTGVVWYVHAASLTATGGIAFGVTVINTVAEEQRAGTLLSQIV